MNGATSILVINLSVAGLLAAAFIAMSMYDMRREAARWMASGYLTGMAYFAIELAIPAVKDALPVVVAAFAVFLAGTVAFNIGLAHKYAVPPRMKLLLVFLVVTTVAVASVQHLPRQSFTRMMAYQFPYALMQLFGAWLVLSSRQRRDWLDNVLVAVLLASAVQFASKPVIAHLLGGWGTAPQDYSQTAYALVSQSLGTVFAVGVALIALALLGRDMLAEATSRSETDALSGLLNRGGFERRATATIELASPASRICLIMADLDHFKHINDSYGHASGDRVIEVFSALLNDAVGPDATVGRMGGEEFAVLLPGSSIDDAHVVGCSVAARFAEAVAQHDGLAIPATVSIGLAETVGSGDLGTLLAEADRALYRAKMAGRNRVEIAAPRQIAKAA